MKAIEYYLKAIELNPNYADAYFSLGSVYMKLKKWNEAVINYEKAIDLKPGSIEAYYNLGLAYYYLGKYKDSIKSWEKVIEINPTHVYTYYNLGYVYYKIEKWEEAISNWKKALKLKPNYADAYFGLGNVYYNIGKYEEAIKSWKKVIELKSDYADAYYNLGLAYYYLERYKEALKYIKEYIEKKQKYPLAYVVLCAIHLKIGAYDSSIRECKKAIKLSPNLASPYSFLCFAHMKMKRYKEAVKMCRQAISLEEPDKDDFFYDEAISLAYKNLCLIYRKLGYSSLEVCKMAQIKSGNLSGLFKAKTEREKKSILITIISPPDGLKTPLSAVDVIGRVIADEPIESVIIQGIKVSRQRGVRIERKKADKKGKYEYPFEVRVPLIEGENEIVIVAETQSGMKTQKVVKVVKTVSSSSIKLSIGEMRGMLPRIWALIVGINNYKDKRIPDLRYAERDAMAIFRFFRTPRGGTVPLNRIKLLLGPKATRANILSALKEILLRRTDKNDLVVIYFVGHGVVGELQEETYLLPYDAKLDIVEGTGISQSEIMRYVRKSRANRIVLIIDACHSGGVGSVGPLFATRNLPELTTKLLKKIAHSRKGVGILTASSSYEKSLEGKRWGGGHGVFTYYLLVGLKGKADRNADGIITLGELYEFVYEKVKKATGGKQHPDKDGLMDIPIAVVR